MWTPFIYPIEEGTYHVDYPYWALHPSNSATLRGGLRGTLRGGLRGVQGTLGGRGLKGRLEGVP